jgi:hypothetical protein
VPIPQDSRVPLPRDSRAPLGSSGLQGLPPASDRSRQGPVDPPRNNTPRPRPGTEPQDVRADINRARQLDNEARRRYGLGGASGGGGANHGGWGDRPWRYPRGYHNYGRNYGSTDRYWYDPPYVTGPYDDGGFNDPPARREWADDIGPVDAGPRDPGGANRAGADQAEADAGPRLPDLPPDELLGDDDPSPALRQALDASAEWKQATAELIRAWGEYAGAVDRVLGGLRDKPEYRRVRAEMLRAKARLDAARAAAGAAELRRGRAARAEPPPDRLVGPAEEAIKARRAIRQLEAAALSTDPDVQRAERRLDNAVDRRNKVRDAVAANLPEADRPAPQKRPKLLEDDE